MARNNPRYAALIRAFACPRCGAPEGSVCKPDPRYKTAGTRNTSVRPHIERLDLQRDRSTVEFWADWLVDAVAGATQDRRFLRDDPGEDKIATEALYINAKKAMVNLLAANR